MDYCELWNLFVKSKESDEDVSPVIIVGDLSGPIPDHDLLSVVWTSCDYLVSDLSRRVPNVDVGSCVGTPIRHVANDLEVASQWRS